MKGNLLYFYPAVSLQRTGELSFFLFLSLPPDLWKLYGWGWRWREGEGEEGRKVHTNTQTHTLERLGRRKVRVSGVGEEE